MNRGLYIGATSLMSNQRRMESLSNDLANINTTGYKKEFIVNSSFPEQLLIKKSRRGEVRPVRQDNLNLENLGNNSYRASLEEGFFLVETPRGRSYEKTIEFTLDGDNLRTFYRGPNGDLVSQGENYILNRDGSRATSPGNIDEALINGLIYNEASYVIGSLGQGSLIRGSFTDFSQGDLMETGGRLDLALLGPGFFRLEGLEGEGDVYSRNGSFSLADGYLVDLDGRRLAGLGRIEGQEIHIDETGQVHTEEGNQGRINILEIQNSHHLRKLGDNNFQMREDNNGQEIPLEEGAFQGRLLQGYLESSNMNAVTGMVDMISLLRDYEAGQKIVRMEDELLEKATTEIGRV